MSADPSDVFVLVPDRYGVAVVAVGDLYSALGDYDTLEEAITNSAIDSDGQADRLIEKVRALNETGDADAYWNG